MSKHMIVLGGGESGVGAALLGNQLGYKVFVSDKGSIGTSFQKNWMIIRLSGNRANTQQHKS